MGESSSLRKAAIIASLRDPIQTENKKAAQLGSALEGPSNWWRSHPTHITGLLWRVLSLGLPACLPAYPNFRRHHLHPQSDFDLPSLSSCLPATCSLIYKSQILQYTVAPRLPHWFFPIIIIFFSFSEGNFELIYSFLLLLLIKIKIKMVMAIQNFPRKAKN